MIKDTARRVVNEHFMPLEQQLADRESTYEVPPEVHAKLATTLKDLGLWALEVPEELGGAGLGILDHCAVMEEAWRCTAGRRLWVSLFFPVLNQLGTIDQKEKYLYPSISGAIHGASAFSEPGAAGDLAGISTTATQVADGWLLNGTKCWITYADTASYVLVLARMPGTRRHDGMTWFVVDANSPGFEVTRRQQMIHGHPTFELMLNDCLLPHDAILGEPGQGFASGANALFRGRMTISARALGSAERCMEMMVSYANERHTFGKPLASRQAIQWMIADSALELHNLRSMLVRTAWDADQGKSMRTQTAMLKLQASEVAGRIADRAVQIHGAAGLSTDMVLERIYRDVRPMRIYEGTSEAMRSMIAKNILAGDPWQ
ncbi:MAG: acyl-CoA dehydrogenase family protein [Pseudomonadales bacterium]